MSAGGPEEKGPGDSSGSNARPSAIVAGGSSGIGLATALMLAADGWDVAIVARSSGPLQEARDRLEGARREPAQVVAAVSADLSDEAQARPALEALMRDRGVPDVLINSAGVIVPGNFLSMSAEDFRANLDHGFWSVVHPCRVVAPEMVARGSGHIVNVSSVAGFFGIWGYASYAASKHAVFGFSESLRAELKPRGVRVSVACPPDTETPALEAERRLRPPETDRIAGAIEALSADTVARSIVRALGKDRFLITPDLATALTFRFKSLGLEVFHALVDRRAGRGDAG